MTGICLGILETGRIAADLSPVHGSLPDMFKALLTPADPSIRYTTYRVIDGEFPDTVTRCDAWLITGSPASVHDRDRWIEQLKIFVADAHGKGVPMVGICFGHQVLAVALGGRVERCEKGWGLGLHHYSVGKSGTWMPDDVTGFAIGAMHQDQVVALPQDAEVFATSDFCPHGLVGYGDTAISFQGHPEFTADCLSDLITSRRGNLIPEPQADKALGSVNQPMDSDAVARWTVNFLNAAVARRTELRVPAAEF